MNLPAIIVIPARYESERLPRKPLQLIHQRPLVQWAYILASKVVGAERVVVATDHPAIADCVRSFGGDVHVTGQQASGTDRIAAVCAERGYHPQQPIVGLQCDEPLLPAQILRQMVRQIESSEDQLLSVCRPLADRDELLNPNVVKVVLGSQQQALYFSRSVVPYHRGAADGVGDGVPLLAHIGLYAYRVKFLQQFVTWPEAPIERAERLEQLRALWHGVTIRMIQVDGDIPHGIDTPEDLVNAANQWRV